MNITPRPTPLTATSAHRLPGVERVSLRCCGAASDLGGSTDTAMGVCADVSGGAAAGGVEQEASFGGRDGPAGDVDRVGVDRDRVDAESDQVLGERW